MCSLQEHIAREIRAREQETADSEKSAPTVEWVRERPAHPVHIPEHLRGIVTEPAKEEL